MENGNGYLSGNYSMDGSGMEQKYPQNLSESPAAARHSNCCCMCRFRQNGIDRDFNGNTSRASLSSNPSSRKMVMELILERKRKFVEIKSVDCHFFSSPALPHQCQG